MNSNEYMLGSMIQIDGVYPWKYQSRQVLATKWDRYKNQSYTLLTQDSLTKQLSNTRYDHIGSFDHLIVTGKYQRLNPIKIEMHDSKPPTFKGIKTNNFENLDSNKIWLYNQFQFSSFQNYKHDYGIWADYIKPFIRRYSPHKIQGPYYYTWRNQGGWGDPLNDGGFWDSNNERHKVNSYKAWMLIYEEIYHHI